MQEDASLVAIADALVEGAKARTGAGDRRHRRASVAVAAALLGIVVALAPAVALSKSLRALVGLGPARVPRGPQVHATLTSRVPASARPGTRIRIGFRLWSRGENGRLVRFDQGLIVARIVNPARTAVSTARAHGRHGRYTAIVRVPSGGIGRVQVGIKAIRFSPAGEKPAVALFPITNYP